MNVGSGFISMAGAPGRELRDSLSSLISLSLFRSVWYLTKESYRWPAVITHPSRLTTMNVPHWVLTSPFWRRVETTTGLMNSETL